MKLAILTRFKPRPLCPCVDEKVELLTKAATQVERRLREMERLERKRDRAPRR